MSLYVPGVGFVSSLDWRPQKRIVYGDRDISSSEPLGKDVEIHYRYVPEPVSLVEQALQNLASYKLEATRNKVTDLKYRNK